MKKLIFLATVNLAIFGSAYGEDKITYQWDNQTSYNFSLQQTGDPKQTADVSAPHTIDANTNSSNGNPIVVTVCNTPGDLLQGYFIYNLASSTSKKTSSGTSACTVTINGVCNNGKISDYETKATVDGGNYTCSMESNKLVFK